MTTQRESCSAIVYDTEDPKKRGRIRVKCFHLTGNENVKLPDWIDPVFDWGWFYIPDVGEEVEIEYVVEDDQGEGVPRQAFLEEPDMRWRNKRFQSDEGEEPRPPHTLFTSKNYGKRRGFTTPLGHIIFFDDTPGDEQITLSWTNKAQDKFAYISFDKTGSALLSNQEGSLIHLDAENKQTKIIDAQGDAGSNVIAMDENGVKIIDQFGNIIELKDGAIQVLSQSAITINAGGVANIIAVEANIEANDVTVEADSVTIDSGDVSVGTGANSPFVRYVEWAAWAVGHVHLTAFGPSAPPLVPPPPNIASITSRVM